MHFNSASLVLLITILYLANCKVYEKCELARELFSKHGINKKDVSTWVCIAKHESHFNTSAVNHWSGDHGIFQISQLFWCDVTPGQYKACGLNCDDLKDDDITNDVICARRIHREHQRLSGNGFNAWVVYRQFCQNINSDYILDCFNTVKSSKNRI